MAVMVLVTIPSEKQEVFRLAYAFFHNHDDAIDIVQETFLGSIRKRTYFRKEKISKPAFKR